MLSWGHPLRYPMGASTMDAFLEHSLASSSRQLRNKAEKQRRDKLNNYITELSTLVPMVASSPKRMDKTSILRLSATYLRMHRCLRTSCNPPCPKLCRTERAVTSSDWFGPPHIRDSKTIAHHLLDFLRVMDGFLMVVNAAGKIIILSETVEKLLGHQQNDLLGQSLYSITYPDDHKELRKNLTPDEDPATANASPDGGSCDDSSSNDTTSSSAQSSPSPRLAASTPEAPSAPIPAPERQRRSFYVHLSQRASSRTDVAQYEMVHIQGYLKVPHKPERGPPTHARSRKQRDPPATNNNDIILVAFAQLVQDKKFSDLSLLDDSREKYVTRHSRDGRILDSDHRISIVAGYMADEVRGDSAFLFMHNDDVKVTVTALQRMYDLGDSHGTSCYRLKTKSGYFIYLKTEGYLKCEGDSTTVICINTLLTEKEGEDCINEMKKRFASFIPGGTTEFKNMVTSGPSVVAVPEQPAISPVALEESLPLSEISQYMPGAEEQSHSPQPGPNAHYVNVVLYSHASVQNRNESPTCSTTGLPVVTSSPGTVSSTTEARPMERPTVLRESVITERVSAMPVPVHSAVDREDARDADVSRWGSNKETVLKRTISADLESAGSSKRLLTTMRASRLRRRDSHPSPVEALRVEVPPTMSPDEQHRAILMRGGGSSISPLYNNNNNSRGQTSPLQAHYGIPPGNGNIKRNVIIHSPTSPHQTLSFYPGRIITRSPSPSLNTVQFPVSEYGNQVSPHSPIQNPPSFSHFSRDQGISVSSPSSAFINCQDPVLSPEHADSDTFSSLGLPEPDNNSDIHDLLSLSLDTTVDGIKPEFIALETLPESYVDMSSSPDIVYRGINVTAEVAPALQDQMYSTMNKELRRHHLQLESRMHLQETQINSIEQDLDQVPLADQVFRTNLTQLQAQHKKQQQLLTNLKQDHHKMHCAEKLKVCSVKQDVGV